MRPVKILGFLACLVLGAASQSAMAGKILIHGSDGDTFHNSSAFADDIIQFLDGGSTKDVLVLGNSSALSSFVGTAGFSTATSLAGVTLDDFSGLYLLATNGCCNADDALIAGFQGDINTFLAAGGNFGIQDYVGESTFDAILGTTGGANQFVSGHLGGDGAGPSNCYYNGSGLTTDGAAAGFDATYPGGSCFGHQGYRMSYFSTLGFTSLYDTPVAGYSMLMVAGEASSLPTPGTGVLLLVGLLGVGRRFRSR